MAIYQGSNAPIRIELPEPINIDSAYALLSIGTTELKTWDKTTMQPSGLFVTLPLTEAETMAFKTGIAKLWYKISDVNKNILFTETVYIPVEEWGDKRPFDIATAGTQEVEPIKIKITTDVHYEGGGGQGGTTVYVNGLPLTTWNADTKQNVLSSAQLNNIAEIPSIKETAESAIQTETDPTVPSWAKANTKPTYTAAEIGALSDATTIPTNNNQLDNGREFITNLTENLVNYYKRSETMSREQILEQIAGAGNWQTVFADTLPATGVINTIYFIPAENPTVQDEKDEFMWNATANKFERIGGTSISLEGLITLTQLNTALEDYYTQTQSDTRFEPKRTTNGTAYNKNFGDTAGTVAEGNRVLTPVPSGAQFTDTVNTDVTVSGTKVATFNADSKQNTLSAAQLANIAAVPNKAEATAVVTSLTIGTQTINPVTNVADLTTFDMQVTNADDSVSTYKVVGYLVQP